MGLDEGVLVPIPPGLSGRPQYCAGRAMSLGKVKNLGVRRLFTYPCSMFPASATNPRASKCFTWRILYYPTSGSIDRMNRSTTALALLAIMVILALGIVHTTKAPQSRQASNGSCQWSVYFSPNGGATQAVVNALSKARKTVLVQAYSFTSAPIAKALIQAHKRGVDVRIILDKSQRTQRYSSADLVANAGIPTLIDPAHAIAHNKIMIIDGRTVITGSFNFTKAAEEKNAENLLVIQDSKLASRYTKNWQVHASHSEKYTGRGYRY